MFENRLKNLRNEKGLSRNKIAEMLEIKERTYLSYENNEREPNSETLIRIAKIFNVSIDYLLGLSKYKNRLDYETSTKQKNDISELLSAYSGEYLLELTSALKLILRGLESNTWGKYNSEIFHTVTNMLTNIGGIVDNFKAIAEEPTLESFNEALYHSITISTLDLSTNNTKLIKLLQEASIEMQTKEEHTTMLKRLMGINHKAAL